MVGMVAPFWRVKFVQVLVCSPCCLGGKVAHSGGVRRAGVVSATTPCSIHYLLGRPWWMDLGGGGHDPSESFTRLCRC